MNHHGIKGKANRSIGAFLSGHKQRVFVDGHQSDTTSVESVPQASILGTSLFLFYINDLPEGLN